VPRSSQNSGDSAGPAEASDYLSALHALAHRFLEPGVLEIGGEDRVAFLQGQLTQEVRDLAPGHSRPAAGLTSKGKLLYFGTVVARSDRILLLVPAALRAAVAAHLRKYAAFQKVSVDDRSEQWELVGLYGPGAPSVAAPGEALRLPGEGELSARILAPAPVAPAILRLLAAAGSEPVSDSAAEILRVEAGRPRFGLDADESNFPDECGLQNAISTTKGCYVGQEVVARLRTYGRVNRRLVGFRFPDGALPSGTVFLNPDKSSHELGRVTSSVVSPRFGAIGLGFAFREVPLGGELTSPSGPERRAVVAGLPFV
jgi:tRNA-modifying protein YgfZ